MNSTIQPVNETNLTQAVDATKIFGPQRDSLYIVIPITIIYSVIFVIGVFGNIFTCLVIVRNKSMHTATNCYLFSLAVSDLLLLVSGMPQEMYSIWSKWPYVFGNAFCVIRGLAAETSTNASVLTITLFTVERYLAICHPFVSHKMSKLSRAKKHVVWLWVVSLWLALPQALQFGIRKTKGVIMCLQTRVIIQHSFEISTFVFFFTPMILITVLYVLIGLKLKRNSIGNDQSEINFERPNIQKLRRKYSQSTMRIIKMLVAVVVAFFVCWAPFHAQRLVAIYGTTENHLARSPILLTAYYFLTYTSGVFYYMSTCINPVLYHIMSNKFREAFKNSITRWCCQRGQAAALVRCSYTAMAFIRNPTSSRTGSGDSQRNEQHGSGMHRINTECHRIQFDGEIHPCRSAGFITSPTGEDFIYKRRFLNDKEILRKEETSFNAANDRRCSSERCVNKSTSSDTITASSEPTHSSSSNEIYKLNINYPGKYLRQN